jgi:hypothetical protein
VLTGYAIFGRGIAVREAASRADDDSHGIPPCYVQRMYNLINQHSAAILQSIGPNHVPDYDWLVENLLHGVAAPEFRRRYQRFWAMNQAKLCPDFYADYFQRLQNQIQNPISPAVLANQLYQVPTRRDGHQSLQFSFVTKLAHMANSHAPIYDSLVAAFYFFQPSVRGQSMEQRIARLVAFHEFLILEYRRVLHHGLLTPAICHFRREFNPHHFTDEKVIDSLIWGYVSLLWKGGLFNGPVQYV